MNKASEIELEGKLVKEGLRVTRQDKQDEKVLKNLCGYMDWINSASVIVSNDSLGMHLGIAMGKNVLGLFGPTTDTEVHFYGKGKAILPDPVPNCRPCFKGECEKGKNCMENISVEMVHSEVTKYIT